MSAKGAAGHNEDPRQSAGILAKHSAWTGMAFIAIVLVAVGLDLFSKTLVRLGLIEKRGFLDWCILLGADALVAIDVALLIGVVGKKSWQPLRKV